MKSVKQIFVYGTLMSGERNHKYFKNNVINIEQATISATTYHCNDQNCPIIKLGEGTCVGELITYEDEDNQITEGIIRLESDFNGLHYVLKDVVVTTKTKSYNLQVFIANEVSDSSQLVNGRWREKV